MNNPLNQVHFHKCRSVEGERGSQLVAMRLPKFTWWSQIIRKVRLPECSNVLNFFYILRT
jgi:hypothetical protein